METKYTQEEYEKLREMVWFVSMFTDDIQRDISIALALDPKHREKLAKRLKLTEEEMQKIIDNAVYVFLDAMMLATMNRCNMFTMAMAKHSNVTGDPVLHEIFGELNERALAMS